MLSDDDTDALAIFRDLASRYGGELTASAAALCRVLAAEYAKDEPDLDRIAQLERRMPAATVPKLVVEFCAGRPLRGSDGEIRPWAEQDDEGKQAAIAADLSIVPEQFRRRKPLQVEPASALRGEAKGGNGGVPSTRTPEAAEAAVGASGEAKVVPLPRRPTEAEAAEQRQATAKRNRAKALESAPVVNASTDQRWAGLDTGGSPDVAPERAHLGWRRFDNFD